MWNEMTQCSLLPSKETIPSHYNIPGIEASLSLW